MSRKINKVVLAEWARRFVWILFAVIIGYLLIASIFSTCYLGGYSYSTASQTTEVNIEHTFYIRDNYIQHIVVFAVFSLLLMFLKDKGLRKIAEHKYFAAAVCVMAGILSLLIVVAGQYYPKYDQWHVIEAAARLNEKVYTDFEVGDYLFVFPFQTGTVLYFQLLSLLFGNMNYVAFQIVNCLWIAFTYYLFVRIADVLWGQGNNECPYRFNVALVGLLFLPYLLYATFLYGTVVGMAFALLSFYMMLLYMHDPKLHYLLICGLSMGIATVVKSNYMIFLIAEVIYLLLKIVSDKTAGFRKALPKLVLIVALFGFFIIGRFGVDAYIRSMNGGTEVKGIPMAAWIAMGLQDGKAAPGWYNGYNNAVYIENDFDYDKTAAAVMDEIKRIVSGYPKDIQTSVSFFVKKVSSQWNNPTFQSLWVLEERDGKDGLAWLLHGTGRYLYIFWVNLLQTWILAGTLLYAFLRFKKNSVEEIILPITFVGGFVFHLFWEAEGLYAILYFPLLLPLSICGYGEWRNRLLAWKDEIASDGWKTEHTSGLKKKIVICIMAMIVVCALSYTDPFAKMIARNENTGAFNTYTQETVNEHDALPGQ